MTVPQNPAVNTAPAAPAIAPTLDDRIAEHAKGFLEDLDANPDPDQMAALPSEQQEQAPEVEAETEAPEPEAETPTLPEVPMVEVDIDGEKFTIPEKVKHRVMADKDYRQKTMELSAARKAMEQHTATAAQLAQQAQQMAPYHAKLHSLENHAQFLNSRLQSPELQTDPVEYNRVLGELNLALHHRTQLSQWVQQQQGQLDSGLKQLRAQQLALDAPKLFEQFPELQKPESQQKLAKYLQDEGLPQEAFDFLNYSAVGTKLAWKAHQFDLMVADQKKAATKLQEKVKTLPAVAQSSRAADASANETKLRREWQKRGGKITDPAFDQLLRSKIRR